MKELKWYWDRKFWIILVINVTLGPSLVTACEVCAKEYRTPEQVRQHSLLEVVNNHAWNANIKALVES